MISKVHGRFAKWTGALEFDINAMQSSKVSVDIDVASIDTKETQRDAHLCSPDFFDASNSRR